MTKKKIPEKVIKKKPPKKEMSIKDVLQLIKDKGAFEEKIAKVDEILKKLEEKFPRCDLEGIELKVCYDNERYEEAEPPEEYLGIKADCVFISADEIREKVIPFLKKHFENFPK